jgi:hypothetical protein
MQINLPGVAMMLENVCAVQKSRPKKHRISERLVELLCKGIIEWRRVLQSTWGSTSRKVTTGPCDEVRKKKGVEEDVVLKKWRWWWLC